MGCLLLVLQLVARAVALRITVEVLDHHSAGCLRDSEAHTLQEIAHITRSDKTLTVPIKAAEGRIGFKHDFSAKHMALRLQSLLLFGHREHQSCEVGLH